ncbi:hypothetical protein T484DRAFT_1984784 [Baffinella frigidus]|nr:hypothetical protein T484DRAFT_1984784 [Cryptophyta sp. CCMP2293]
MKNHKSRESGVSASQECQRNQQCQRVWTVMVAVSAGGKSVPWWLHLVLCASRTVRVRSCPAVLCERRVAADRGVALLVRSPPTPDSASTVYTAAAVCVPTCEGKVLALGLPNREVLS